MYKKAFWVGITIAIVQQLTGINAVMFYAPIIFKKQGGNYMVLTFICFIVQILATFSSIFVTDKLGRRFLLIVGAVGCASGLFVVTIFYPSGDSETNAGTYVFDVGIYFFITSFGISYGPVW